MKLVGFGAVGAGLSLRWTIGDVSERGFEALRLSVWGALRVFGPQATYAVCVNSLSLDEARARAGGLPRCVQWHEAHGLPSYLRPWLDQGMAEGVAWKLAPPRLFPDRWELSLDNDCILWSMPAAVAGWLRDPARHACLLAEDVRPCFGRFQPLCGREPRNSGMRGLSPGLDLDAALQCVLERAPGPLRSGLDEQGLQVAALESTGALHVVPTRDVSICSPIPPHQPELGRCGAHFVGVNARRLGWEWNGRPGEAYLQEHWDHLRAVLYARVGAPPRAPSPAVGVSAGG